MPVDSIQISIIIINYKSIELIKQCIKSLENYSQDIGYEIIIVDNSSSEADISFIKDEYKNIRLIRNLENLGFAAANNQGLKIANGEFVLFLNNDTIFIENTLKKIYDYAVSLDIPSLIGCKLLNSDLTLQYSVYDYPSLLNLVTSNFGMYLLFPKNKWFNKYHLMNKRINTTTKVDVVTGAFIFGPKKEFQMLGGFDERFFFYNEETDLCYRFKKQGGQVIYFPETSLIHLKGTTIKKNLWNKYRLEFIAYIKYYQKHFSFCQFLIAIIIHYLGILIRIPIFLFLGFVLLKKELIVRSFYYLRLLVVYPKNTF